MFKSLRFWIAIFVGGGLILVGHLANPIASSLFGESPPDFLNVILDRTKELPYIGFFVLLVFFIVEYLSNKLENFFTKTITPIVDSHVENLTKNLDNISNTTKTMLSERLLENIVSSSNPQSIRDQLKNIHARAYGEHCAMEQGFYTSINQKYLPFLERKKPHRSEYQQTVTVVENDAYSIKWHEVCTYKIHTIGYDTQYGEVEEEGIDHRIKFSTMVEVSKLTLNGDNPSYSLKLNIDDETLFDAKDHLVVSKNGVVEVKNTDSDMEWLEVKHTGNSLEIGINKPHKINKAWTKIEIIESSTITDDYFISRRNEPTYGANININLPDGWYFENINFGHPEDWNIHQHPVNTLSAHTRTWLLPGITFFCKWKRPKQVELNLKK